MKKKRIVPCPELTLAVSERRKRARMMAAIGTGTNPLTKRQIRRLPSRQKPSKHSLRQERRQMARYARAQGVTTKELLI